MGKESKYQIQHKNAQNPRIHQAHSSMNFQQQNHTRKKDPYIERKKKMELSPNYTQSITHKIEENQAELNNKQSKPQNL